MLFTADADPVRSGRVATLREPAACAVDADSFRLMSIAIASGDEEALKALARRGSVLLVEAGTRGVVTAEDSGVLQIEIESGENIGRRCTIRAVHVIRR